MVFLRLLPRRNKTDTLARARAQRRRKEVFLFFTELRGEKERCFPGQVHEHSLSDRKKSVWKRKGLVPLQLKLCASLLCS